MRRGTALLIAALTALATAAQAQPRATPPPIPLVRVVHPPLPQADRPPVILVSIDGFRADYLARGLTPTLQALADGGVRAAAMHPAFPSLTFPNHYTLVTGLTPDHHGVVANTMEDAALQPDARFTLGTYAAVSDARWWDEAEPIWVTARKAGLRAATLFWPGSEAPIGGCGLTAGPTSTRPSLPTSGSTWCWTGWTRPRARSPTSSPSTSTRWTTPATPTGPTRRK